MLSNTLRILGIWSEYIVSNKEFAFSIFLLKTASNFIIVFGTTLSIFEINNICAIYALLLKNDLNC